MKRVSCLLAGALLLTVAGLAPAQSDPLWLETQRQAAEQGDTWAQNNLGGMYRSGLGVPQDYAEAMKWFRLAAAQGAASAQYNLGIMYDRGRGVPQDAVQAHKWLNLAASRTGEEREKSVKTRDLVARRMTAAQIAEAQRLAREWKPKMQEN